MNRTLRCLLLLTGCGWAAVTAGGQESPPRLRVAGERLATFECSLDLADVDPRKPETLARAKVETDEALLDLIEPGFALLLIGELRAAYVDRMEAGVLEDWAERAGEARTRAGVASAGRTVRITRVEAPRDREDGGRDYPVTITRRSPGDPEEQRRYRVRVRPGRDGGWIVSETLAACLDCQGYAWTAVNQPCGRCRGNAWRQVPGWTLAEAPAVDRAPRPPTPRDDREAAEQILTLRHRRSREVLARFVESVRPAHEAYVRTFLGTSPEEAGLTLPLPARSYRFHAREASPEAGPGIRRIVVDETVQWADGVTGSRPLTVLLRDQTAGPRVVGFGIPCVPCAGSGACPTCRGTGTVETAPCGTCAGQRRCAPCEGGGIAPIHPFTPQY